MSYLKLVVFTFLIMSYFIMLGYPFKRWVERQEGTKRKLLNPILILVIVTGFVVDVFLNWLLTLPFLEAPHSLLETVTMRVKRYKKEETGYKLTVANWLCAMVNKFDAGHC